MSSFSCLRLLTGHQHFRRLAGAILLTALGQYVERLKIRMTDETWIVTNLVSDHKHVSSRAMSCRQLPIVN